MDTKASPAELQQLGDVDKKLGKLDPEMYEEAKRRYEQEMAQMQGMYEDEPPLTLAGVAIRLIANWVVHGATKVVINPFMRTNLITATQHELVRQGRLDKPFGGVVDTFQSLRTRGGWMAMLRGAKLETLSYLPEMFSTYVLQPLASNVTERLAMSLNIQPGLTSFPVVLGFSLGSLAFVHTAGALIDHPVELVTQRYQADLPDDEGKYEFESATDCAKAIVKKDGFLGLYTGFGLSSASLVAYRFTYFVGFDVLLSALQLEQRAPALQLPVAIAIAIGAMTITHPIDVIRHRINQTAGSDKKYNGAIDCAKQIVEEGGWTRLYSGLKCRLLLSLGSTVVRIPLGL